MPLPSRVTARGRHAGDLSDEICPTRLPWSTASGRTARDYSDRERPPEMAATTPVLSGHGRHGALRACGARQRPERAQTGDEQPDLVEPLGALVGPVGPTRQPQALQVPGVELAQVRRRPLLPEVLRGA